MQITLLYVLNTPLIVKLCNRFSIGVNDWPLREIEIIFLVFDCAIVFPLMQLNVNTYANSIIESSFTLMKFMKVLMNVYLRYNFNYWRKWLYILRKWTAKGVVCLVNSTYRITREVSPEKTFSGSWVIALCLRPLELKRCQ